MNLMPEVGFLEIVVIAVIALVVVGPKDLPHLMRMAGRMAAQARRMASEFTAAFNQMARESEMEDMRKEIEALKRNNPVAEAKKSFDDAMRPVKETVMAEAADLRDAGVAPGPGSADPERVR
jgi:sec-independent protein translocase protein TatB